MLDGWMLPSLDHRPASTRLSNEYKNAGKIGFLYLSKIFFIPKGLYDGVDCCSDLVSSPSTSFGRRRESVSWHRGYDAVKSLDGLVSENNQS